MDSKKEELEFSAVVNSLSSIKKKKKISAFRAMD